MTTHLDQKSNINQLEKQLRQQKDNRQRLVLLDQLASHYTFTNVRKGQKCLAEIAQILQENPNPDFELNYHKNKALIENQLYNYLLAEQHFKKSMEIVEERGDIQQQVDTYIDYAGTCINLDKREMAKYYLEEAEKKLKAFPDRLLETRITCRLGFLNLHVSNYARATELLLNAEKNITAAEYQLGLKDYYFLTLIYSGLGRIYEHNGNTEKSVNAYLKGANLCETIGMRTRMSWHYLNVGKGYMALEELDSAEIFFSKAIKIKDDISQVDFTKLAETVCGDAIATNIMMVGYACQKGLLPVSAEAIEKAIELNAVAVNANKRAFNWGRKFAAFPEEASQLLEQLRPTAKEPDTLEEVIEKRDQYLVPREG